jgi:hypothetical protein
LASGVQTSGVNAQENVSSNGTLKEQGSYNNGTFTLSSDSYSGGGSDSYSSSIMGTLLITCNWQTTYV